MRDLNAVQPNTDDGAPPSLPNDYAFGSVAEVSIFFRDIKAALIREIDAAESVVGCVAWLTDFTILEALARKHSPSIIIQKEDFLRPDIDTAPGAAWRHKLRDAYTLIKPGCRFDHAPLRAASVCSDPNIEGIRCCGLANSERLSAWPRMHHKFLVFGHYQRTEHDQFTDFVPRAVWTGSFNFTRNATMSMENAMVIRDWRIAAAYYNEWGRAAMLSEPLNWDSVWVQPEWRYGT